MSLTWIQVERDFLHNAAIEMAKMLGVKKTYVAGAMSYVWDWCSSSKSGAVKSVEMIEAFAEWDGEPGAFVAAMCAAKLSQKLSQKCRANVTAGRAGDVQGIRIKGMGRYDKVVDRARNSAERKRKWRELKKTKEEPATQMPRGTNGVEIEREIEVYKSLKTTTCAAAPVEPEKIEPSIPKKPSEAQEFFESVQNDRVVRGRLVREKPPKNEKLNAWFKQAKLDAGGADQIWVAWQKFVDDPDNYWREKLFPFQGFMAVWRKHAPRLPENFGAVMQ